MASAGLSPSANLFNQNRQNNPVNPTPFAQYGDPASFTAGATTQASDYDNIMKQYQDIANNYNNSPIVAGSVTPGTTTAGSVAPTTAPYTQSADVTKSLSDLSGLAETGGYSEADKADIRARDISPTRSIYANAQENVNRARALGGGYSPNANATQASMARDESQQISDINTNANAGIAQNVAANRLAASGAYGSESAGVNAEKTSAGLANADITNRVNTGNVDRALASDVGNVNRTTSAETDNVNRAFQAQLANRQGRTGAVQGQQSLYGTTPALTNTFGNQVTQAAGIGQNQQGIDYQRQRMLFGQV